MGLARDFRGNKHGCIITIYLTGLSIIYQRKITMSIYQASAMMLNDIKSLFEYHNIPYDSLGRDNMGKERWKPVIGYEGYYEVSDFGRVRRVGQSYRKGAITKQIVKPQIYNQYGHMKIHLSKMGTRKYHQLHRLVLTAFKGYCPRGMECRHLDGNAQNNHISNLEWNTHRVNLKDMDKHGTRPTVKGSKNPCAKLTENQVIQIRHMLDQKIKQQIIATQFNVSAATISLIKKGKRWQK